VSLSLSGLWVYNTLWDMTDRLGGVVKDACRFADRTS
jgi:hypothetical protein